MHIKSRKSFFFKLSYSKRGSWTSSNNTTGSLWEIENLSSPANPTDSEDLKSSIYSRSLRKHMFMAQSDCLKLKPQKATLKKNKPKPFFFINIYSLLHGIISDLLDCSLPVPSKKETKRKTRLIFLLFAALKSHSYKDREQKSLEQLHSSAWA